MFHPHGRKRYDSGVRTSLFILAAVVLAAPAGAKIRVKTLLQEFEQGGREDRVRLAPALGRTKDKRAVDLLLEAFDARLASPRESDAIVQGLGLSGDLRAVEPLQNAWDYMRTAHTQMAGELPGHLQVLRWRILEALARIGGEKAVAVLSEAVNDADTRVVQEAVRGLGILEIKDAVPALQQLALKGGDLGQSAIEALGEIGDKRALSALEQILKSTDKYVEVQALYALAKLGQNERVRALERALEGDPAERGAAIMAAYYLVKLDKNSGIAYLDSLARKKDDPLAPLAAEALGKTGNERAVLPLVEALKNPDSAVRLMAAGGLGRLGGARALSALKKLKSDPNPGVRSTALAGLDEWGERD